MNAGWASCATGGADHGAIIFSPPLHPTAPTRSAGHQGTGDGELLAEKRQEGAVSEQGETGSGFGASGTGCTIRGWCGEREGLGGGRVGA